MVSLYRRLMADPLARSVRPPARRQHALTAVALADRLRNERGSAAAWHALAGALPRGASHLAWWVVLAKTCVRPLLPPAVMRLYHAVRRR
jgi:hypothetical protein